MKLKRTIAAILAFLALASFAGCRKDKKDDPASTSAGAVAAETSENETETEAETETETSTEAAGKTKESSTAKQTGVRKNEKKYPRYYIGIDSDVWNHWSEYKSRSVYTEHLKKVSISNGEYEFDRFGNVTYYLSYDGNNTDENSDSYKKEYDYNSDGTVKTERIYYYDAFSITVNYEYDSQKRVIREIRFIGENLQDSRVIDYTFNAAGLLISVKTSDLNSKELLSSLEYKYDSAGNMIESTENGYEGKVSVLYEKITHKYDAQGNCIAEKYSVKDSAPFTREYKYDKNGFIIEENSSFESGGTVYYYTRDKYGNPLTAEMYEVDSSGKKTLVYKQSYTYEYGNDEITVNMVEVNYKPNGKIDSKEDGVYIFKYFENTPVRSLIDNCVLPHA
ncbi:MAG: hypothetical protein U0N38_03835 [Acutalibacteraceae bacterium]